MKAGRLLLRTNLPGKTLGRVGAGADAIAAKTVITDDAGASVYVFCDLSVDNPPDHDTSATMVGTASARQTVALKLTHTFASAGTITLSCESTNPAHTTNVGTDRFIASGAPIRISQTQWRH